MLSGDNGSSVDAGTGTVAATIGVSSSTVTSASATTVAVAITSTDLLVSGFVASRDTTIVMTDQDDTINLVVGESNLNGVFAVIATGLSSPATSDTFAVSATAITGASSVDAIVNGDATGTVNVTLTDSAGSDLGVTAYSVNEVANASTALTGALTGQTMAFVQATSAGDAQGSEAVTIELGGGSDAVSLVLGSAQTEVVVLEFARSDLDERETISFDELADLAGASGSADAASGLILDFKDDVSALVGTTGTSLANVAVGSASQHNAIITYTHSAGNGFFVDVDGDGRWTDGDINVDLTEVTASGAGITVSGDVMTVTTNNAQEDQWDFELQDGNLVDELI